MKIFQNYHRHSYYTNPKIADSTRKNSDYAIRAVELGHGIISSMEHGWQGRYIESYELAEKHNLKFVFSTEAYWVKDRLQPDRTNSHIFISARNEDGRQAINDILSEANITGFYHQARIDLDLILSLKKEDVIVCSSCIAFWKYEDIDGIVEKLHNHFGESFFLEVQYHNTVSQKDVNQRILGLSEKLGIEIIMGCDSHYITEDTAWERDDYIKSKGIDYADEEGWYLDYPDGDTAYNRFIEQGVLSEDQINRAMDNTNVFLTVEEYHNNCFTKEIKMPTLYPNLTQQEKDRLFMELISQKWEIEKHNIPEEKWVHYYEEIGKECRTIINTKFSDYFLFDYELVKLGIEKYNGVISPTGRGCFTKDALIHTDKDLKPICDIKIGDKVIDINGEFKKVTDTMFYDVEEELIQIKHLYGTDLNNPTICTKDHKILINRDNQIIWVEAQNILAGDFVCVPKINTVILTQDVIDLNNYNTFNFKYDEEFIYEDNPYKNNQYDYSILEVSKKIGISADIIKKFISGDVNAFKRNPQKKEELFLAIPFKTKEEYLSYLNEKRTLKIKRFIKNDFEFNVFLGLLYGDGWKSKNKINIGLAIHSENRKDKENKQIFYKITERLNLNVKEFPSKTKKLNQLGFSSKIFSNFIEKELFISKKGRKKLFNPKFFYQSDIQKQGILHGLSLSDGSKCEKRISFDNTSTSLINAYKLLYLMTNKGINSLGIRKPHICNRGYNNKKSYKLRYSNNTNFARKKLGRTKEDKKYWYLPITDILVLPKSKQRVYDLTIEDSHSYLINNMLVHNSAVSNYTNKLLGLTMVDRISAEVKMYPERFMSETRIIESKGMPDIDLNFADPTPFINAQKELLEDEQVYPMLSYGTMQPKAAWKMYAKSQKVNFEISNAISNQIFKYEMALKNANSEEDKEDINIEDYIEDDYKEIFESSKSYLGVISDWKISPCSFLLYQGNIRKEIGLIKAKENLCCLMDKKWADKYKFMKNDLLKVSVVDVIDKTYKKIGIPMHTITELLSLCPQEDKAWDVYKNGWTMGINQVEQNSTRGRVIKYKPNNISELCAFVAAVRPGFKSMYKTFENRENFAYGIKSLDDLIQTPQFPQSFIMYQEIQMAIFNYAGIPMTECYDIIKNISKKNIEEVLKYKNVFCEGFNEIMINREGMDYLNAKAITDKIWQILEDSAKYSFNSSHSYCVSLDSLYGAYLKSHYPIQFYSIFLQVLEDGGDKDRMSLTRVEAESAYHVYFPPMKFRQDNREICGTPENNQIVNSLQSIKGFSKSIAENLYNIKDVKFDSFVDLLVHLEENGIMSTKIKDLIGIQYFSEFGKNKKLTEFYSLFVKSPNKYSKTLKDKAKEQRVANLRVIFDEIPNENFSLLEQIKIDTDLTGYVQSTYDVDKRYAYVQEVDTKYAPRVSLYCLANGKISSIKIRKQIFKKLELEAGQVIYCEKFSLEPSKKFVDGNWIPDGTNTWWLDKYKVIDSNSII